MKKIRSAWSRATKWPRTSTSTAARNFSVAIRLGFRRRGRRQQILVPLLVSLRSLHLHQNRLPIFSFQNLVKPQIRKPQGKSHHRYVTPDSSSLCQVGCLDYWRKVKLRVHNSRKTRGQYGGTRISRFWLHLRLLSYNIYLRV